MNIIKNSYLLLKKIVFLSGNDVLLFSGLLFACLVVASMDILGIALIGYTAAEIFGSGGSVDIFLFDQVRFFLGSEHTHLMFFLVATFVFKFIVSISLNFFINYRSSQTEVKLREALLFSFQSRELQDWQRQSPADYLNITNVWVNQYSRQVLLPFLKSSSEIIILALLIIYLFNVDWQLFCAATGIFTLLVVSFLWLFRKPNRTFAQRYKAASSNLMAQLTQTVDSYKEIKILGLEDFFRARVRAESQKLAFATAVGSTLANIPRQYFELALILMFAMVLFLSMATPDAATDKIPVLSIFALAGMRGVLTISALMSTVTHLLFYKPIVESLFEYMNVDSIKQAKAMGSAPAHGDNNTGAFGSVYLSNLTLSNIRFSYDEKESDVFHNVNVSINKGDKLFITGPSGQGKSTFIEIILGMLPLNSGSIHLNGADISSEPHVTRSLAAYVPQRPAILSDSIKNNIAFGEIEKLIDEEKIVTLLKQVALYDFVNKLPETTDTQIGDGGLELSGGQRQRVAIARALYTNRSLIIFDEATSALDADTENKVVSNLLSYSEDKTILFVSHRKELAKMFTQILTIENGNVLSR